MTELFVPATGLQVEMREFIVPDTGVLVSIREKRTNNSCGQLSQRFQFHNGFTSDVINKKMHIGCYKTKKSVCGITATSWRAVSGRAADEWASPADELAAPVWEMLCFCLGNALLHLENS